MKLFAGSMLMFALALFSTASYARTPPSSFVPRNSHEPHATLNNKNASPKGGRYLGGRASVPKSGRNANPRSPGH
jgi:hypothetical protein